MNKNKENDISKWLDQNLYNYDPPIYLLNHRKLDTYYLKNDNNLLCNNEYKIRELTKLNYKINNNSKAELVKEKTYDDLEYDKQLIEESQYIHVFKTKQIEQTEQTKFIQYINPYTPRYHINMLFNKIIDYCYVNNIVTFKEDLLIDKKMRNKFVKFCFDNSKIDLKY